ncbi:hypothetical protein HZB60_00510 [candidate division KSB1 bacterium]|nr:hypothetical protein [candidate division KSB1 bacterium]
MTDSIDALIATPSHHREILVNDKVQVLDTCIYAGEMPPIHSHRWPAVLYILSWSGFVRYDDKGELLLDSRSAEAFRTPPKVLWSAPLPPHYVVNVGDKVLHVISVELKDGGA